MSLLLKRLGYTFQQCRLQVLPDILTDLAGMTLERADENMYTYLQNKSVHPDVPLIKIAGLLQDVCLNSIDALEPRST